MWNDNLSSLFIDRQHNKGFILRYKMGKVEKKMDFKKLNDSRYCLPANPGTYQWFSKFIHDYIPVIWDGQHWHINGSVVDKETVRYWR